MLKNHLKLSFRNLWKNRMLSMLNLLGLSIGIGSVLTLIFSVYAYYSADANLQNQENIYYLKTTTTGGDRYNQNPYPLMDKIIETSPAVIAGTHVHGWGNIWLDHGESEIQERTDYVDPEFFNVFTLPLKYGETETALENKYSIILTDRVSQKIYGEKNPVGETLIGADSLHLTVTGVFAPISPYSSFRLGVVLSNEVLKDNPGFVSQTNWHNSFSPSYFRLRSGTDIVKFESQVNALVQNNYPDPTVIAKLEAMPYEGMRMDSIPVVETIIKGNIATAFFILLIVLVNLLNLNTSTMFRRTKSIAVRKILGGSKRSVIIQFCLENGILVLLSILISGGLFLGLLLPMMNNIFGADFGKIGFSVQNDFPIILGAIVLGLMVTLVVGIFPTLRFISVPISIGIKGKIESIKSNFMIKNPFIILQFSIAIFFICVAIILNSQIGFMKNADLGFKKENVITAAIDLEYKNLESAESDFVSLLNELEANPYVKSVATSEAVPSDYYFNYTTYHDPNTKRDVRMRRSHTDEGYLKTLEIPLAEGRDFDRNIDNVEEGRVLINQTAMKALGWKTIEGKRLKYKDDTHPGYPVVGVMEDFHYQDLQNAIEPLVHFYRDKKNLGSHRYLSLRVQEGQEKVIGDFIKSKFEQIESRRGYNQSHLNDKVSGQYRLMEGMLKTVNVAAILTIFISCLGLFGLISFMAKRRIKEIGIRKVLGAGVFKIMVLLSKDYIILTGIAALVAFPLAWYMMNAWLGSFAYSIAIQWWMFAVGGLIAFLITSFTLGIQAIKSATANPVKSLRTE